jgi:glucosamine--fructose-6-phosphate aminotransferase (isomerizing)
MCGITGFLGSENAFYYLITSLLLLQNRGYDSAGICTIEGEDLVVSKYASRDDENAIQLLQKEKSKHNTGTIGIGHTRWATHGAKTDTNAHPHLDSKRNFAVVHNGIIENYNEIRDKLKKEGMEFQSQTDTETIPKLLEYYLQKEIKNGEVDFENNVLRPAVGELQGTWAIAIVFRQTPNKIYLCKNGSPLVLGVDNNFCLISSEQLPLSKYFNNYISLNDGDIVCVEKSEDGKIKFPNRINYLENAIQNRVTDTSCYPYPHWTMKEIMEQPMSILRTLNMGGRILGDNQVKLGGLDSKRDELLRCQHLILLGCGTSLNAAQIGCKIIRSFKCMTTVSCLDASEFTVDDIPMEGKTGFVLFSQSGETKDLHRCIELLKHFDYPIVSIVNVVGSLIARESDCGIYLNAGREVGVGSTKSFTSQVVAVTLLAIWFSQNRNTCNHMRTQYIKGLRSLSLDVEQLLSGTLDGLRRLAAKLAGTKRMFILGRSGMKFVADEGSLKIKEIGYIHCEGCAGGSLKHGPFALIDSETVIVLLAPNDENFSKMMNCAEEVHSRGARTILVTNTQNIYKKELFEQVIQIPRNDVFNNVLSVIPLQILAYEIAVLKGHNPDFPRNLAKVVTVDG